MSTQDNPEKEKISDWDKNQKKIRVYKRKKKKQREEEVEAVIVYCRKDMLYNAHVKLLAYGITPSALFQQLLSFIVYNDKITYEQFLIHCRSSFMKTLNYKIRGGFATTLRKSVLKEQQLPTPDEVLPEDKILSDDELKQLYDIYQNDDLISLDNEYLYGADNEIDDKK